MERFPQKSLLAACLLAAAALAGCSNEPLAARPIQSAVVGLPPKCLPGTRCKKLDPPVRDPNGNIISFDCYGACGASCKLAGYTTQTVDRCQDDPGPPARHRIVKYDLITGNTHPFCRWHDACYLECAKAYGDGGNTYDNCVAMCDYACVNPYAMNRSCTKGKYAPGFWNRNVCGAVAIQRVDDPDKYVPICCKAGMVPDPSVRAPWGWSRPADCLAWASTAQGPNPIADAAPADGTVTFSELSVIGDWQAGACPAGAPKVAAANALIMGSGDEVALAAAADTERLDVVSGDDHVSAKSTATEDSSSTGQLVGETAYDTPDMGAEPTPDMASDTTLDMASGGTADMTTSDGGATAEVCEPEDELCEDSQCNVATCRCDLPPDFVQPVLVCGDGGTVSDGGVPQPDASQPPDADISSEPDLSYTPWPDAYAI
jgi:hypothetical protein